MNSMRKVLLLFPLLIALAIYNSSGVNASDQDNVKQVPTATGTLVLRVVIIIDPPPNQLDPPRITRFDVTCMTITNIATNINAHSTALSGYNVYRVPQPPLDQPSPTAEEIVGDPKNLVGSIPASSTVFEDKIPVSVCGNTIEGNFCYALTSAFENGTQSLPSPILCTIGSRPAETAIPVIKNPVFRRGTIRIDVASSFIKSGALLIVNDKESYPLQFDETRVFFIVSGETPGSPGGLIIKKVIKKGCAVRLIVKNPDGKLSAGVWFTR